MDFWNVLGIEPTDDKNKIKTAYMEKLSVYHPEEDPEGFGKLREAYEQALKYESESKKELTEIDIFMNDFKAIYSDFYKRINLDFWHELFSRDICDNIDSEFEVCKAIFEFLTDDYFLPHDVFKIMADKFLWEERIDELKKTFHPDMIDYMLNRSRYEYGLDYYTIEGPNNADYDEFISSYLKLDNKVFNQESDELDEEFEALNNMGIYSPDARILEARYNIRYKERLNIANQIIDELLEKYDNYERVFFAAGNVSLENQKYDEALEYFNRIVEIRGNSAGMGTSFGDCYYGKGDYVEAKKHYKDYLEEYPYNTYAREKFYYTSQKLTEFYEDKIKTDDDSENRYLLAAAYFNCNEYKKALEVIKEYNPPEDKIDRYFDFLVDLHNQLQDFDMALKTVEDWELIGNDGLKFLRQKAYILYKFKRYDELIETYEKGIELYPDEPFFYHAKALRYFDLEEFHTAMDAINYGLSISSGFLEFYILAAEIQFKVKSYSDAISYTRSALSIYPYLVNMYRIQVQIYFDVDDYDTVISVANSVENFGCFDDEIMYHKAMALGEMGENEKAVEIFNKILENNNMEPKYYCELSRAFSRIRKNEEAIANIDKALELELDTNIYNLMRYHLFKAKYLRNMEKFDQSLAEYKLVKETESDLKIYGFNEEGLLYLDLDKYEEAIKDFEEVISMNPQTDFGYSNLGDVYYNMKDYEKAMEFYNKQLEFSETGRLYTSIGLCYYYMGDAEKEKEYYLKSISVDPDYAYAYNNMGYLFYTDKNYNEAIEYYKMAIERNRNILSSHRCLSDAYYDLKQYDLAIEVCNEALNIFTGNKEKRLILEDKAFIYYHTERHNEAIAVLKNALEQNLESGNIYEIIGSAYFNLKDYVNALKYYNIGLEKFEEYIDLHESLGDYFFKIKYDFKTALKHYSNAVTFAKELKEFRLNIKLAQCLEMLNKTKEALKNYSIALETLEEKHKDQSDLACNYVSFGNIYLGLGEYEKALHYFYLAIDKSKTFCKCFFNKCDRAYFGIGNVYKKKGDIEKAIEFYDRAIEIKPSDEFIIAKENLLNPKKKSIFSKLFKS